MAAKKATRIQSDVWQDYVKTGPPYATVCPTRQVQMKTHNSLGVAKNAINSTAGGWLLEWEGGWTLHSSDFPPSNSMCPICLKKVQYYGGWGKLEKLNKGQIYRAPWVCSSCEMTYRNKSVEVQINALGFSQLPAWVEFTY